MTSGDLLSLIAELAIALVAAAGIVTAIGGGTAITQPPTALGSVLSSS
jgi:hypothetical protein